MMVWLPSVSLHWQLGFVLVILGLPTLAAESQLVLDDPAADLEGLLANEPDYLDLIQLRLDVAREPELVILPAGITDLETHQAPFGAPYAMYAVQLEYRSQVFDVDIRLNGNQGDASYAVYREGGSRTYNGSTLLTQDGMRVPLPYPAITTASGFTPTAGESVRVLSWASSWDTQPAGSPTNPGGPAHTRDFGDIQAIAAVVPGQETDLSITSPRPVQRANGGETTYAWDIELADLSGTPRDLVLNMTGIPDARFYFPQTLTLEAGATSIHRVYAVLPFAHAHGQSYSASLTASDGTTSQEISLEVLFIHPPQPTGHHDTVYLHAQGPPGPNAYGRTWMNTTEAALDETTPGSFVRCGGGQGTEWRFPLDPGLEVGIDGDLDRTAALSVELEQLVPGPDFQIRARLGLQDDKQGVDMGDAFVAQAAWPGFGRHAMALEVPLPPELDYVEPAPSRNLIFVVQACEQATSAAPPLPMHRDMFDIHSGGSLVLPFFEFRAANSPRPTDLNIQVEPTIAMAPPGSVASWAVQVAGPDLRGFEFTIVAPEEYGARLERVTEGAFRVSILVPTNAEAGNLLDLLLVGNDVAKSTVVLRTIIDRDAPFVERVQSEGQASPAGSVWPVLAMLAVVAALRKRR